MAVSAAPGVGFVDGNSNQSNGSRNSDEILHGEHPREPPIQTGSAEKKTPGERRRKRKNQDALNDGARGTMDGGVKPQAAKKINEYFPRNAPGSPGAQAQGM